MLDKKLFGAVYDQIPEMNPDICNGLATSTVKYSLEHVDRLLSKAGDTMPRGLVYHGIRKLTPVEELAIVTNSRSGIPSNWDIAGSDVFLCEMKFEFEGNEILKHLYLPFCRDAGLIKIRGSVFSITPVLADKALSISDKSMFIQVAKAKFIIKTTKHHLIINGVRRTPTVPFSWLHNRNRKLTKNSVVRMTTTLAHYLFCKFGVKETFKRYLRTDIVIGNNLSIEDYPADKWIIARSTKFKPKGVIDKAYTGSDLSIAMPLCDYDVVTESMLGSLFYVVDHFPEQIQSSFLDGTEDEILMWRILLGHIIGGNTGGEGAILKGMDKHMESIEGYIDSVAISDLAKGDLYVEDIYDVLWYLISLVSSTSNVNVDSNSSLSNKTLLVLRYVLQNVNDGLFRMFYLLKNKESKKSMTFKQVNLTVKNKPNRDIVLRMPMHGEITPVNTSSDNKILSVTSNITLQTDSGTGSKNSISTSDNSKFLHSSIAEIGSYLTLPGREATGRGKINPWVRLDAENSFVKDPAHKELIKRTQERIRR